MSPEDQRRAWILLRDRRDLLPGEEWHGMGEVFAESMAKYLGRLGRQHRRLSRRDHEAIQETIKLREQGPTTPEIAAQLCLTEQGVKKRFNRARKYGILSDTGEGDTSPVPVHLDCHLFMAVLSVI